MLGLEESMDRALCLVKFKDCFELLDRPSPCLASTSLDLRTGAAAGSSGIGVGGYFFGHAVVKGRGGFPRNGLD